MKNIIINGVNLKPGSSVLLVAPEHVSDKDAFELKLELESRFDGVTFVFLAGDFQLIGTYPTEDLKVIEA